MKSLQTIQKTFRVFQILIKIALIFSIVGASMCAVGALCSIAWYTGGQVFSLFGEPIPFYVGRADMSQTMAVLLSDLVYLTSNLPSVVTGIVLILASLIFRYGAEREGKHDHT